MILTTFWRWRVLLMTTGVTLLAGLMRFVGLGQPTELVFDEVFYVRGAYSLLTLGYEGSWGGDNQDFAAGDFSHLSTEGDYVVHPLVGKLLIAAGMDLFGPTPFGWRFMAALLGTATVVIIAFVARHLLRSTLWGAVAGVLLAVDGAHVVLSRTALLDVFLTFFVVAGFALLVVDRAYARRRLFQAADALRTQSGLAPGELIPGLGPLGGWRPWRLLAIITLALSVSVKWSGLWFMATFLVLSVVWDWADRRAAGVERWFAGAFVWALPAVAKTLVVLPAVYLASWIPWLTSKNAYGRTWAQDNPGQGHAWLPESLRSLAHYHGQMWGFHSGLDAEHNYMAKPWGWLLQWRPTAFHFEDVPGAGCGAERCVSAIHSVGHPFIWWVGVAALVYALWRVLRHRDMLALTVSVGVLAGWVPWFMYSHRTIFTFYMVVVAPFLALTVAWMLSRIAQEDDYLPDSESPPSTDVLPNTVISPSAVASPSADGPARYSRTGVMTALAYVALVLVVAGFFVPIWTGQPIPYDYWQLHMWLPTWV